MIYTKSSLQVVNIVEPDKEIPAFNTITFLQNGGIVAGNRKVFFYVSPLSPSVQSGVPLECGELDKDVTFWADSVKNLLRIIPRDTKFKGLLETCDISLHKNGKYYATINDGINTNKIELRESFDHLEGWHEVFMKFTDVNIDMNELYDYNGIFWVSMNRKRFKHMLDILDKVLGYDGNYSPVHLHFTSDYDVMIRCKNELNEQRVCIISTAQETDDYPLDENERWLFYGQDEDGGEFIEPEDEEVEPDEG